MNIEIFNKYKWLIILALVMLVGVFLLFFRFYHNDIEALADFSTSYEKFDKAISDFLVGETDDLESRADDALIELHTKAVALRVSSLIKNDAELMNGALEIADFSARELDNLRAYQRAIQSRNADLDGLAKEHGGLTGKRKTAYARFQELAGFKD